MLKSRRILWKSRICFYFLSALIFFALPFFYLYSIRYQVNDDNNKTLSISRLPLLGSNQHSSRSHTFISFFHSTTSTLNQGKQIFAHINTRLLSTQHFPLIHSLSFPIASLKSTRRDDTSVNNRRESRLISRMKIALCCRFVLTGKCEAPIPATR